MGSGDIQWHIAVPENVDKDCGIYFLRTNVATFDEKTHGIITILPVK